MTAATRRHPAGPPAVSPPSLRECALRARPLAVLCRPANVRKSALLLAGAALGFGAPGSQVALGLALLVLAYAAATIYNDLQDLEIDRANRRDLPLVTGEVTPGQARMLMSACIAALALLQVWSRQPAGLAFTAAYLALSWAYSAPAVAVERRGLAATVLLGLCYAGLPLAFGLLLAGVTPRAPTVLAATLLGAAALVHKDAKDEEGDRRHGKRTPLVRYGAAGVRRASGGFFVAGAVLLVAAARRPLLVAPVLVLAAAALLRRPARGELRLAAYHLSACIAVLLAL